jgi:glycosyltransferase involved in cell wall biosynthesis
MSRICLVTSGHLASNPRLVKEAGALVEAGHRVHVVSLRYFPALDQQDAALRASASWQHTTVDTTSGFSALAAKIRRRLLRPALKAGCPASLTMAAIAHHAAIPALAAAASRIPADLYIGHCLAGLVAAGLAARRTGTRHGFDAEDFHSAETTEAEQNPLEHRLITRLELAFIPGCATFTAASPLIGRAYVESSRPASPPVTVLNTFPLAQAPSRPPSPPEPDQPLRLYWFSQTIGPGRGLEALVAALARMKQTASLHLRGIPADGFADSLRNIARHHGWTGTLEFLPFGPPDEMPRLAAGYDLGLSLELRSPRNRDLCLTNKIFTYLLAGLPVALSPTSAQDALRDDLGPAALALPIDDPRACAALLDQWWADRSAVAAARAHAWHLGQTRYNWDHEKTALVATIGHALS